jgi:hypothetical protein
MKIKTDALDRLFSQYIRTRDNFTCRYSGQTDGLMDCAHVYSRRHRHTRWHPDNAVCLSKRWHMWFTDHPHEWADWTRQHLGHDTVERMAVLSQCTDKITDADRVAIGERLMEGIRLMGEKPVCGLGRRLSKVKPASKYKRKVDGSVVLR